MIVQLCILSIEPQLLYLFLLNLLLPYFIPFSYALPSRSSKFDASSPCKLWFFFLILALIFQMSMIFGLCSLPMKEQTSFLNPGSLEMSFNIAFQLVYLRACSEILVTNRGVDSRKHIEFMVSLVSNSRIYYVIKACFDSNRTTCLFILYLKVFMNNQVIVSYVF